MANKFAIPSYPCDKELFPAFDPTSDAQAWRESTTFYNDFKIAERFGTGAIKDTFKRAFKSWKESAKYMCELCCVSNHLLWEHYTSGNHALAKIYDSFYKQCYAHIYATDGNGNNISPFTDEEIGMIYKVMD